MKTLCKFSLFIAIVLALGCGKKKLGDSVGAVGRDQLTGQGPDLDEKQAKDGEEEGSLESRCFEGDPEACDELGH